MSNSSVKYTTSEIERYFSTHRIHWEQFYESERTVLSRLGFTPATQVLDIGCGCGGLGLALAEKFGVGAYTGLEINAQAAATGRRLNPAARILEGDFLMLENSALSPNGFDVVISLSCIDWNIGFEQMLPKAFACVRPEGRLVISLRLTDGVTLNHPHRSYQYINYAGDKSGEKASYVVLNGGELFAHLRRLEPEAIEGTGFWGKPSATAVTPAERICFTVLAIKKTTVPRGPLTLDGLKLPADMLAQIA